MIYSSSNAAPPDGAKHDAKTVSVHVFNREGKLVGPVNSPRVVKTPAEWKKLLTPEQFAVIRSKGTERPFCGRLLDNKEEGVYTCVACGLPLFASDSKFHSGTGWPSFFQPIGKGNVAERADHSHGMTRTEINCGRCDGHLGHVFDDGPRPTGLRFCLNSESLNFTPSTKLAELADPAAESAPSTGTPAKGVSMQSSTETAVFAGGCFWCTEAAFEQLLGVGDVESGYSGGSKETANYPTVCTGATGHAEAIRITYDPKVIRFDQLLDVFFDAHDPTQLNQQGHDIGTQYRSAVFYANEQQKKAVEDKIAQLTAKHAFKKKIVTTLEPLKEFYPAEVYHQDYARLNPNQPYILSTSYPKACKVRDKHPELMKKSDVAKGQ
ncbi:MAG: bifunctional methionine sulfoxide reductase B/A protein [Planctomycetes bacterium]|nr:bifunctional methionine sulfoxide reductase B/A protein [Planctomycetota bacterium]